MVSKEAYFFALALYFINIPLSALAKASPSNYNGFFVGAGMGANATSMHIKNSSIFKVTSTAATTANSEVSAYDNRGTLLAELEFGYGHAINDKFYFGLTGFLDAADRKTSYQLNLERTGGATQHDNKSSSSSLSTVTGGIIFEPALFISSSTLFQTFIGWELANIELKGYQFVNLTPTDAAEHELSKTATLNSLRVGIGFQEQLTPSISFGVRYLYSGFIQDASIRKTSELSGAVLSGPFTFDVKTQNVSSQTVLLNLRYYFNNSQGKSQRYTHELSNLNGYYFTGNLGANIYNISGTQSHLSGSYSDNFSVNEFTLISSQPKQQDTPAAALALGLSRIVNDNILIAFEGSIEWEDKDIVGNVTQEFRPGSVSNAGQLADRSTQKIAANLNNLEPSVDLKLGFIIAQRLLPYLRAGAAFNKVDYSTFDQLIYNNSNTDRETISISGHDNKSISPFLRLGAGVDYLFSSNGSFSLNYVYTSYGEYKINTNQNFTDSSGNPVSLMSNNRLSLRNNVLSIGYTHYFNF